MDISSPQAQQYPDELVHKLDEQSEFMRLIAHQLKTPLTGIKWSLNMLLDGDMGTLNPEQEKIIKDACINNERMIALVEKLRQAYKNGCWKFTYTYAPVDLDTLITTAIEEFTPRAHAQNKEIIFERKNIPCSLVADSHALSTVLEILFDNALKYSEPDPKNPSAKAPITLSLECTDTALYFSIHNYGCTVTPHETKRIFKEFIRSTGAQQSDTEGSGIGLYTAHRIITDHGGAIAFVSTPETGTTITCTLPFAKNEQA